MREKFRAPPVRPQHSLPSLAAFSTNINWSILHDEKIASLIISVIGAHRLLANEGRYVHHIVIINQAYWICYGKILNAEYQQRTRVSKAALSQNRICAAFDVENHATKEKTEVQSTVSNSDHWLSDLDNVTAS